MSDTDTKNSCKAISMSSQLGNLLNVQEPETKSRSAYVFSYDSVEMLRPSFGAHLLQVLWCPPFWNTSSWNNNCCCYKYVNMLKGLKSYVSTQMRQMRHMWHLFIPDNVE